ncbi:MAG TPA: ATP-binding protein [Acidimicrobiales bacterium]|nr:ATP-binding protein [Acidimicrobiales bacterium]
MRFRIRSKLAAALAVPLVALVVIAGLQAVQANEESDRIEAEADLAFVALGPGSVTTALQNERNYTSLDLIGLAGATTLEVTSVAQAREETDAAVDGLRSSLAGLEPDVRSAFEDAFGSLDRLTEARAAYDAFEGDRDLSNQELADEVFGNFTTLIDEFFDATSTVATKVDEAQLRNGVELVDAANRRSETIAVATRNVVLDTLTDGSSITLRVEAIGLVERLRTLNARIEQLSVGPYADVATETFARAETARALEIFEQYTKGEDVAITELLDNVGNEEGVLTIPQRTTDVLAAQANELSGGAYDDVRLYTILAAAVIALAIIVTYVSSTSITRPLRKLRDEADEMAGRRLPEAVRSILDTPFGDDVVIPELAPIQVKTRDEVGEVVAALNKVQERTLSLAADQAVLRRNIADSFVNLGRRNQNLLDRQLEFITELEQVETEPDQLEALFRLDHLATRMRRNAESLLVLAGTESPRQWGMPVEVDAVVRAGLGEVEDYRRVHVRQLEDAAISGGAAAAVSHVVAELAENALQFSPPDEDVEIKGRRSHEGYVIAVADNGIGMSPEDLERANRRLSGEESYTVAPSKYLGHYVAGQLAARLGVTVRLQDNPAGGIIATVVVPPTLLEGTAPASAPAAPVAAPPAPAPEPEPEVAARPEPEAPDDEALEAWFAQEPFEPAPAPVEPAPAAVPPAAAPVGASSLSEALGSGRLDRVDTVADLQRAFDGEDAAPPPAPGSGGGLPRRVPGAQRPDASPLPTRLRRAEPAEEPTAAPGSAPTGDERSVSEVATAGLFGFLAEFQSGAARAEASTDEPPTEEER